MRMAALAAILVIGWGAAAQAAPRAQFDLACTGTVKDAAGGPDRPWNDRLAIDLAAGSFCEGMCEAPRPLAQVDPGFIYFDAEHGFGVNRMTGEVSKRDATSSATGKCRPEKFTPFSHRLF